MPDTHVTIVGNLTDDAEVSFTPKRRRRLQPLPGRDRKGQGWRHLARRRHVVLPDHRLAAARHPRRRLPGQRQPGDRPRPAPGPELGDPGGGAPHRGRGPARGVGPSLRWATAKPEGGAGNGGATGKGEFNDDPPF